MNNEKQIRKTRRPKKQLLTKKIKSLITLIGIIGFLLALLYFNFNSALLLLAAFSLGVLGGLIINEFRLPTPSPDCDLDEELIDNRKAFNMINRQIEMRYNTEADITEPTVSGLIKLCVLEKYINRIKKTCDAYQDIEFTGLEYYFARYSNAETDVNRKNRTTILFYPTYGEEFIPFDPISLEEGNLIPVSEINPDESSSTNGVLNKSHMSPPRSNTY